MSCVLPESGENVNGWRIDMQEIILDEGKIKCLITGKMRKETPEEYVRQEYCRVLLDV